MIDPAKTQSPQPPQVKERALRPSGLLPKNVQTWAVLGIAAVMILVIALSGNRAPSAGSSRTPEKPPNVVDPNEARIWEYRNRIDEDARRLAAEQERLRSTKQAIELADSQGEDQSFGYSETSDRRYEIDERQQPAKDPVELDRARREYQSLFASNIALTYRKDKIAGHEAAPSAGGSGQPMAPIPQSPYGLFPASMPVLSAPQPQAQAAGQPQAAKASTEPAPKQEAVATGSGFNSESQPSAADKSGHPRAGLYRIFEGTILEGVLTNRLSGSFSGPVNCILTTDVYSRHGQNVLIPRGSRVLGEANKVEAFGQERLAVAFHRLIMPDSYSVRLDRMPGMEQAGETGLRDQVNNHYVRIFGMTLAIGALSGLTQYNTRYGLDVSSGDIYRQGVSRSLADSSIRILDRFTNILPTFTIREGHRVKIYLTGDLDLPAYDQHAELEKGVSR